MNLFAALTTLGGMLAALASSCKILPHEVRSGKTSKEVGTMLDTDSIQFARLADQRSGRLNFTLKDQHSCRIEYWARDPNGTPPPASPLSIECPKTNLALTQAIDIGGLTPSYPLSFRIYVWPKTTTFLSHFVKDFSEGQDLARQKAQDLVVVRYLAPRQSAEIYSYRSPNILTISEIKTKVAGSKQTGCTERPTARTLPFPRGASLDDSQKRPFHGLSGVKTEGFGSGVASLHPFFATRLIESYEQTARQENWVWNFAWENMPFSFQSLPPGYIGNLSVGDGLTSRPLTARSLTGTIEMIDLTTNTLRLEPRIIFPTDVSRFELAIKTRDASEILLACQFGIDQASIEIPADYMSKLAQGVYLATFTFETSQIHFKDQEGYPPWIITAQDVVQFRLNKRL